MHYSLQQVLMWSVDQFYALYPQPVPSRQALEECQIVSHRGERDNRTVFENTFDAFDQIQAAGAWGIECDIRWTRDLVPVVIHDPDGERVFGQDVRVSDIAFEQLREELPLVPSLAQLVQRYGGKLHLWIEIKDEPFPDMTRQSEILAEVVSELEPVRDYHFLALDADLFDLVTFVEGAACFPVAETNVAETCKVALARKLGGVTGHYLLLGEELKRGHEAIGQSIGTGFINSRNCLFRELNRGVRWIFTNQAVRLQTILNESLDDSRT